MQAEDEPMPDVKPASARRVSSSTPAERESASATPVAVAKKGKKAAGGKKR